MAAIVVGGLAPDLDLLLLPFAVFNAFHRTASHSLVFVALVAVTCMVFTRQRREAVLAGAALGGLLHLLVDSMMDTNPTNGIGVALFWPFSNATFSPFNAAFTTCPGWGDLGAAAFCNLAILAWEAPLWVASLWIAWRQKACSRVLHRLRGTGIRQVAPVEPVLDRLLRDQRHPHGPGPDFTHPPS
jgi:membrane-bound metal-dependent hydrolase YbcI (DUF457 family)